MVENSIPTRKELVGGLDDVCPLWRSTVRWPCTEEGCFVGEGTGEHVLEILEWYASETNDSVEVAGDVDGSLNSLISL